jgi:hypothetical protein
MAIKAVEQRPGYAGKIAISGQIAQLNSHDRPKGMIMGVSSLVRVVV